MGQINPQSEQARENARKSNGEFGSYNSSESGASLGISDDTGDSLTTENITAAVASRFESEGIQVRHDEVFSTPQTDYIGIGKYDGLYPVTVDIHDDGRIETWQHNTDGSEPVETAHVDDIGLEGVADLAVNAYANHPNPETAGQYGTQSNSSDTLTEESKDELHHGIAGALTTDMQIGYGDGAYSEDGNPPEDEIHDMELDDESQQRLREMSRQFAAEHGDKIQEFAELTNSDMDDIGLDISIEATGHGVGFSDRAEETVDSDSVDYARAGELANELEEAAVDTFRTSFENAEVIDGKAHLPRL